MGGTILKASLLTFSLVVLTAIFGLTLLTSQWDQEIAIGNSAAGEPFIEFSTLMIRPIVLVAMSCLMLLRPVRWQSTLGLSFLLLLILNQFWLDLFGLLRFSIPVMEYDTWFLGSTLILLPMLLGRAFGFQLHNSLTGGKISSAEPYQIRPTILHMVVITSLVAALAAWLGSSAESNLQSEITWPLVVCGTSVLSGYILLSETQWYLQVGMLAMLTIGSACLLLGTSWRSAEEMTLWAFAAQLAECMTLVGWCIAVFGALRGLGWRLHRKSRGGEAFSTSQATNLATVVEQ